MQSPCISAHTPKRILLSAPDAQGDTKKNNIKAAGKHGVCTAIKASSWCHDGVISWLAGMRSEEVSQIIIKKRQLNMFPSNTSFRMVTTGCRDFLIFKSGISLLKCHLQTCLLMQSNNKENKCLPPPHYCAIHTNSELSVLKPHSTSYWDYRRKSSSLSATNTDTSGLDSLICPLSESTEKIWG